ncbi:hypothetical protein M9458_034980, partial [Cirrhinus mrigala]
RLIRCPLYETAPLLLLTPVKSGKPSSPLRQRSCLEFGPVNSHVVLGTRPGYMPMVTTTPSEQVVTLQAIPYQENDPNLILLCPVRVPRITWNVLSTSDVLVSSLSVMEHSRRGRL